jgi:prepilin-type N-terminal cleavage/methylation domain-containing protein
MQKTKLKSKKKLHVANQKGFTLIELISVMVIMGVMTSVAVKKFDLLSGAATDKALQQGVKELNARENLTWIDIKLSSTNWANDGDVYSAMDTNLGSDFDWTAGPSASGGTLRFRNQSTALNRIPSTFTSAGSWK